MPPLLRGALIEYGTDFLGPIPNVVIFQFNPESLGRSIAIPNRSTGATNRELNQAGEPPVEEITLTAYFSAADHLNDNDPLARMWGVGPQLAALEKMVYPARQIKALLAAVADAVGEALSGSKDKPATQPIPREKTPRLLFIWGLNRVLPVVIKSMRITEKQYDSRLNPVQAEVALTLATLSVDPHSDDWIAKGAQEYSEAAKEAQALANLANVVPAVVELIPF
jgi:hypothetical protein